MDADQDAGLSQVLLWALHSSSTASCGDLMQDLGQIQHCLCLMDAVCRLQPHRLLW